MWALALCRGSAGWAWSEAERSEMGGSFYGTSKHIGIVWHRRICLHTPSGQLASYSAQLVQLSLGQLLALAAGCWLQFPVGGPCWLFTHFWRRWAAGSQTRRQTDRQIYRHAYIHIGAYAPHTQDHANTPTISWLYIHTHTYTDKPGSWRLCCLYDARPGNLI